MISKFDRSVLVTGGTTGLGYHCALTIARKHPEYQIIIASRSDPTASADTINKLLKQNNVRFLKLDLSKKANIFSFAAGWEAEKFPPIQSLVFNAALQFPGAAEYTDNGFEKTFAISHIGHALLFHLLRSYLADSARVVVVSSRTHDPAKKSGFPDAKYTSAEHFAHPPPALTKGNGRQHYTNTKLANVLYMYALHRRFQSINGKSGRQWTATAFDPGLMPGTGIAREASPILRFLWIYVFPWIIPFLRLVLSPNVHTPEDSGASLARLAIGSDVEGLSGVYFEGGKQIKSSQASYDEAKQEDLWKWTVSTLARDEEEKVALALSDFL